MSALNSLIYQKKEYNQRWTASKVPQIDNNSFNKYATRFVLSTYSYGINDPFTHQKINQINIAWEKEYNKYAHYIKNNQEKVSYLVKQSNQIVAKIHFEDFEIELTPNNSVKYTLLLPDKKLLMITKSFENLEEKGEKEIVFSIFENRKLILSDIKNLDELVIGINRHINLQRTLVDGAT